MRSKGALFGAIIGAALGFTDALLIHAPYGSVGGVIAAYVFFMIPWALIGALIGLLVGWPRKPWFK